MNIVVNGESKQVPEDLPVKDLLALLDVDMPDMVSVEINGNILARGDFGKTRVKENDKIEFLYFMGGGAERRWRRGER